MKALASTALVALVFAGCTSVPVILERTVNLQAETGFAEVNLIMEEGQVVSWDWSAPASLMFNVHSHADEITEHVSKTVMSDKGSFTAPAAGSYSLMWMNHEAEPVVLTYRLTGESKLDPAHAPVP